MLQKCVSGIILDTPVLSELNLPTLQDRKSRAKLQMMYKIIHHLVAIPVDCLTPAPSYL